MFSKTIYLAHSSLNSIRFCTVIILLQGFQSKQVEKDEVFIFRKILKCWPCWVFEKSKDDRRAAISKMVEKSGGNFIDLQFLIGKYDIAVVAEVSSFEDAAAVKILVAASGALDELEMLEYIDMNDIAARANKITGAYRAPGA